MRNICTRHNPSVESKTGITQSFTIYSLPLIFDRRFSLKKETRTCEGNALMFPEEMNNMKEVSKSDVKRIVAAPHPQTCEHTNEHAHTQSLFLSHVIMSLCNGTANQYDTMCLTRLQ